MNTRENCCQNCGKVQEGPLVFAIGASLDPDWCVVEGTGRFVCPECYPSESEKGQLAIRGLVS